MTLLGVASSAVAATLIAIALVCVTEAASQTSVANENDSREEHVRKLVREQATQDARRTYSPLLDELELAPEEKDAMLALLIEDQIARTTTRYWRGTATDEHERLTRIADIIGDPKGQQFLALERHLHEYWELQNIAAMLQQNGVPLTDAQRDGLFNILVEAREQSSLIPSSAERGSLEELEQRLIQRDEYERRILELAPSVLSSEQAPLLFDQYQYLSHERAYALHVQQRERADPTNEDSAWWYPTW